MNFIHYSRISKVFNAQVANSRQPARWPRGSLWPFACAVGGRGERARGGWRCRHWAGRRQGAGGRAFFRPDAGSPGGSAGMSPGSPDCRREGGEPEGFRYRGHRYIQPTKWYRKYAVILNLTSPKKTSRLPISCCFFASIASLV